LKILLAPSIKKIVERNILPKTSMTRIFNSSQ